MARSVRRTVLSIMAAGVGALVIVGGVPAIAEDADPPAPSGPAWADLVQPNVPGAPAPHPPRAADPKPRATMTLRVEGTVGGARHATLTCKPAGGDHPKPAEACEQLDATGGEISEIPPEAGVCTAEYAPVTLVADGTWAGGERSYRRTFGNRCQAIRTTGGVLFDF